MQKQYLKSAHWILIAFLPFLAGCQTGISSVFGLLSFPGGSFGDLVLGIGGGGGSSLLSGGGGDAIAVVHNPEPASMLLMGSGMMAMAYFNKKRQQK